MIGNIAEKSWNRATQCDCTATPFVEQTRSYLTQYTSYSHANEDDSEQVLHFTIPGVREQPKEPLISSFYSNDRPANSVAPTNKAELHILTQRTKANVDCEQAASKSMSYTDSDTDM
jgi:hypothetical protein